MSTSRCLRFVAAVAFAALGVCARADTIASLLGNFTINQFSRIAISERAVDVRYSVVFGQLPALRELHLADADGDGVTTDAEREARGRDIAASLASQLHVAVDGEPVALHVVRSATSLPGEQGGFSLRVDVDFVGALPRASASARSFTFGNDAYAGRFGWQEIVVETAPGIAVYDTDAFSTSLTNGLTESLSELPATGPLAERSVHLAYREGRPPPGAQTISPRPGTHAPERAMSRSEGNSLQRATRRIVELASAPDVAPHVALWALLAAMLLGAVHAFSPGHGKTVVGAYLIGSRATARHAAFLGLTVTVTHTIGVYALGFATLAASAYVLPERILPILGFVSGLLVLGMGVALVAQRWPAARVALRNRSGFRTLAPKSGRFVLAAVDHAHTAAGWHSHGGTWHTHLPPGASGDAVTWRSLLALGVSGGLVPCPSAMVLLLAAVALNKTAFGLALVVAFSLGLAATLSAIGFALLYARSRLPQGSRSARWVRVVPLASAAVIVLVGLALCFGAVTGTAI
jgi:ABC-type nickel/cobalt efflux system permease component RcnA